MRAARRLGVATSLDHERILGPHRRPGVGAASGRFGRAGLGSLAVSVDRYHDEFQGPTPALLIARAAEEAGLPVRISLVVPAGGGRPSPRWSRRSRAFAARGFASTGSRRSGGRAGLPAETMGGAVDGFCSACAVPAVTDDGRLTACNGPAYFAPGVVAPDRRVAPDGAARDPAGAPPYQDPILDTIRTFGPARLRDELRALPGSSASRSGRATSASATCACTSRPTRTPSRRSGGGSRIPRRAAERRAAWLVIQDSRRRGELNAAHINGPGAAPGLPPGGDRAGARWTDEAARILCPAGRRLEALGVVPGGVRTGPAAPARAGRLRSSRRWAPAFFTESAAGGGGARRDPRPGPAGGAAAGRGRPPLDRRAGRPAEGHGASAPGSRGRGPGLAPRHRRLDVYVGPGSRARPPPAAPRARVPRRAVTRDRRRPITWPRCAPGHPRSRSTPGSPRPHWGLPEAEMLGRARPLAGGRRARHARPGGPSPALGGPLLAALLLARPPGRLGRPGDPAELSRTSTGTGLRGGWRACGRLAGVLGAGGGAVPRAGAADAAGVPARRRRATPSSGISRRWPGAASSASPSGADELDPFSRNGMLLLLHDSLRRPRALSRRAVPLGRAAPGAAGRRRRAAPRSAVGRLPPGMAALPPVPRAPSRAPRPTRTEPPGRAPRRPEASAPGRAPASRASGRSPRPS